MYFNNITIFKIYNYLNINDLFNCSLINKQFNNLFNCDLLWKNIIAEKYEKYIDIDIDEIKKQYNIINFKYIYKKIIDLLYLKKTLNLKRTVKDLINLQKLNLSNKKLKEIPKEIGSLINLQTLHLSCSQLKEIPKELYNLANCIIKKN